MDKSINLVIDDTRNSIVNIINESQLPISVIRMIIEQLHNEAVGAERNELARERQQLAEQNQETLSNEVEGAD